MDLTDPDQLWAVLAAVAIASYLLGRASAGRMTSASRDGQKLREQEAAAATYAALETSKQVEIDALIEQGKIIDAIRSLREETGMRLYEAKLAIDERRKIIKGA